MAQKKSKILIDSWKKSKTIKLVRSSPCGLYPNEILDRGVNYFILALEKLGCETYYSCEGHFSKKNYTPQFYISFNAPTKIIKQIKKMLLDIAYLEKENSRFSKNEYSIRIDFDTNKDKTIKLTKLSQYWNKVLGSIEYENF